MKEMKITGKNIMIMFALMAAIVVTISHAQQPQLDICGMSMEELIACRPSATRPNPAPPSLTCCTGLSHANGNCLCSFRNSTALINFNIDPELALQLPQKCGFAPANCN